MTLFYLAIVGRRDSLGVIAKIRGKLAALHELGQPARALLLFELGETLPAQEQFLEFAHLDRSESGFSTCVQWLRFRLEPDDQILLRYPMASRDLYSFLQALPGRCWLEHNTKEIEELWTNFRKYSLRDWLWMLRNLRFQDPLKNLLALWREKRWGKLCLGQARGGIAVTDEISEYESKRCAPRRYHCYTVSNGIDTALFRPPPAVVFDGRELRMVMASTSGHEWHGVDRLLRGLQDYRGPASVRLHLVGNFTSCARQLVRRGRLEDQVIFHPPMSGSQLAPLLAQAHLGIGSLGMHRIPLRQGAVLKVKEYLALGLPFVIAHEEVDLVNRPEFAPFFYQAPADESPICIQKLLSFAEAVHSIAGYRQKIRDFACRTADVRVKMAQLLDILQAEQVHRQKEPSRAPV